MLTISSIFELDRVLKQSVLFPHLGLAPSLERASWFLPWKLETRNQWSQQYLLEPTQLSMRQISAATPWVCGGGPFKKRTKTRLSLLPMRKDNIS